MASATSNGRVLVVDDSILSREQLAGLIRQQNYEPIVTSGGAEALAVIEQVAVDVVLLDMLMPGISGLEVLEHLEAKGLTPALPVVVVSALTEREERIAALEHGATDFLTKPIDPNELAARLRTVVRLKNLHDQLAIREGNLRAIMEAALDGIITSDDRGQINEFNPGAERLFGYTRAEIIGQNVKLLMPSPYQEEHDGYLDRFRRTGERRIIGVAREVVGLRKDGSTFPMTLAVNEIKLPHSGRSMFVGLVHDITNRIQVEKFLLKRVRLSELTAEVGHALAESNDLRSILSRCGCSMLKHLDAALVRVWTWNESTKVLDLQASAGTDAEWNVADSSALVGQCLIESIAQHREPYLTNSLVGDPRLHDQEFVRREGITAFAGYPLICGGHLVGVLALFSRHSFSEAELDMLSFLAQAMGSGIDRCQAEQALVLANQQKQLVLDAASEVSIIATDPQGVITTFNRGAEKMLGYTAAEMLNRQTTAVFHDASEMQSRSEELTREFGRPIEGYDVFVAIPNRDGAETREWTCVRKDGQRLTVELVVTAAHATDGRLTGYLGVATDITQRKQAEQRINQLNADLQQRAGQLDAANKELESFTYSVSHDLRAPLRHVQGYVEMLTDALGGQLPDKARQYLKTIKDANVEMSQLIDDLLAFSRNGLVKLRKTRVGLDELVQDTIRGLEMATKGRNIVWKIAPLPPVFGDSAMLKQILANLAGNAVKYSRQRDPAEIEIGCAGEKDGQVILFMRDNGAGFDMKFAHKLFRVFQRLHRADEFEGTGIGLATVQRIVARHGGRTWAESVLNQGATFYFTLPTNGSNHGS